MRTTLRNILFFMMAVTPWTTSGAFTEVQVTRASSKLLTAASGYTSYQWQVSTDGLAYLSIPSATENRYLFQACAPSYYRVQATKDDGTKLYLDTFKIVFDSLKNPGKGWDLPTSHGYVEVNGSLGSGISIPEGSRIDAKATYGRAGETVNTSQYLTSWTNLNAHAVWFAHQKVAQYDTKLLLTITRGFNVQFRLRVYNPNDRTTPIADSYICLKGTGAVQTIDAISTNITKENYYCYDLQCLSGNTYIQNIRAWRYLSSGNKEVYTPAYVSAPSVHLSYWSSTNSSVPTGSVFDWCYQEVMIPAYSDFPGTYCMSLGVLRGYMGIQNNGTNRHDVIFSMWDDGSTDTDPGLATYKKAGAVDYNSDIATVTRFANEGTGAKTFAAGNYWTPGRYVQFITNARPETATYTIKSSKGTDSTFVRKNTLVTAWFNALDGKGWQYMSTVRLPGQGHFFDSWYSFLENYDTSGNLLRRAYYRNGYAHGLNTGKWYHFNKASFGHTDGGTGVGARTDYSQGRDTEDPKAFFMQNGHYVDKVQNANTVAINTTNTPVDTIDLNRLLARVDLAVQKEVDRMKKETEFANSLYVKTGWKMVSFSSEETSGEGTNGRAAEIIDGNATTYWHSAWQSGTASFPHQFVIDMLQKQPINGFQFTLSGGTSRHMKSIEIYASNDGKNWHQILKNVAAPDAEKYYLDLDSTVSTRYFKLVILGGWTSEIHTRINEVDVTHPVNVDGISTLTEQKASRGLTLYLSPASPYVNVVAPVATENMKIELYSSLGSLLLSKQCGRQVAGGVTTISVANLPAGIYVVRCTAAGKQFSRMMKVK